MLIHNKDDIQFVTEFSCFLGHPVDISSFLNGYSEKFEIPLLGKYNKFIGNKILYYTPLLVDTYTPSLD